MLNFFLVVASYENALLIIFAKFGAILAHLLYKENPVYTVKKIYRVDRPHLHYNCSISYSVDGSRPVFMLRQSFRICKDFCSLYIFGNTVIFNPSILAIS